MPVSTRRAPVEQFLDLVLDDPDLLDREFDQIVSAQDWGFPRPPTREPPVRRPHPLPDRPGRERTDAPRRPSGGVHPSSVRRGERGPPASGNQAPTLT